MKHLSKILFATMLVLGVTSATAQDSNNPWAIGIQTNAVDFHPTEDLGGTFNDYFNVGDHWNILPSVSRLTVSRYIGSGFVFELAGSVNRIEDYSDTSVPQMSYYAVDGSFNYSLRALLNDGWLDPVVGIGGGYTSIGDSGDQPISDLNVATLNGKVGLNFWFTDNIALTVESNYKHVFDETGATHFQHAAGVKFMFGGTDSDGDGIYDKDDECPETPGLPEFNGCPDSDGDGIEDRMDTCPDEAGMAEFDGCPDTDGDGVPNNEDDCPEVAGLAEMNGCPDSDGDGVADNEDDCPNEAGPAENNGCPEEDRDNDGVLDKNDDCPDVAGTQANNGCPEPDVEVIKELNEYSKTVTFEFDSSKITGGSQEALNSIVDIMKEYPQTIFHIGGHTDSVGADAYNMELSKERASSVEKFLEENGVPKNRITSEGYGEERPISSNSNAAGREDNRRVEISLDKDKEMKDSANDDGNM